MDQSCQQQLCQRRVNNTFLLSSTSCFTFSHLSNSWRNLFEEKQCRGWRSERFYYAISVRRQPWLGHKSRPAPSPPPLLIDWRMFFLPILTKRLHKLFSPIALCQIISAIKSNWELRGWNFNRLTFFIFILLCVCKQFLNAHPRWWLLPLFRVFSLSTWTRIERKFFSAFLHQSRAPRTLAPQGNLISLFVQFQNIFIMTLKDAFDPDFRLIFISRDAVFRWLINRTKSDRQREDGKAAIRKPGQVPNVLRNG